MAIALTDLLDARHVKLGLRSRTMENATRELVALLAANEQVAESEKFASQVIDRELANPSIIEYGVVFPHARTDLVEKIVLAIGRKSAGIPFGPSGAAPGKLLAEDQNGMGFQPMNSKNIGKMPMPQSQRANLIFLIGVPQRLVSDYLICVGALARIARNDTIRAQLMRAPTPDQFIEILRMAASPAGAI